MTPGLPAMFVGRLLSSLLALSFFLISLSRTIITAHTSSASTDVPTNLLVSLPAYPSTFPINLNATHTIAADGTQLVYRLPPSRPKGALLLLHGCGHAATDFFPRSATCPTCIGLPEEMRLTDHALRNHYIVLAVSSTDRQSGCWRINVRAATGPDYDRVATALTTAGLNDTTAPPLFAVGISSGGAFASSLSPHFRVLGVVSIVAPPTCLMRTRGVCVPHVFTHMHVRDDSTAVRVRDALGEFSKRRLPATHFEVPPRPVTPVFLREAVPHWSEKTVTSVITELRRSMLLDDKYFLKKDPRGGAWREVLQHLREQLNDSFVADKSPLSEELNRAWGAHEITSEFFPDALSFLEVSAIGLSVPSSVP